MTARLHVAADFPLSGLVATLAPGDTMHDGRDDHYLAVGLSALRCIEGALGSRVPGRILDLPCGFGRVTRVLRARYPDARITVSDLDRPGVDFAAAQFGATGVYSVDDLAALELDGTFDLIWVGSLVTHLSEAQTRAFLQALHRSMAADATLVVSSHGPTIVAGLKSWLYGLEPASAAGVLDDYGGCGYGHRGYGGSDGYGISLTDRHWWGTAAADHGFTLVSYQEQAWDGHQDVLALRKQASHLDVSQRDATYLPTNAAAVVQARHLASNHDRWMAQFDTAYYLAANPDVAAAISDGHFRSAYDHYLTAGRVEGRRYASSKPTRTPVPSDSPFDEAWYLRTFPDVAAAVSRGECLSGYDHWLDMGRSEGRPPHG